MELDFQTLNSIIQRACSFMTSMCKLNSTVQKLQLPYIIYEHAPGVIKVSVMICWLCSLIPGDVLTIFLKTRNAIPDPHVKGWA